jgi:1A family penicillin-binding protein
MFRHTAKHRIKRWHAHRKSRRHIVPIALALLNLAVLLVVGCGATLVGGGVGAVYAYRHLTEDLASPEELASQPLLQVTQLYDRTGQHLLYEFYDERRIAVPLGDVSPAMVQATLAIEDANFFQHRGYDPRSIVRAAAANLRSGETVSGASTITQQLVKRMLLSDERTFVRKLREVILAMRVEALYSKEHILEMYLNQVYYGNQAYGVEAASLGYFGKRARELDLAEASLLAGLVQLPSRYDPVTNRDVALRRQAQVLEAMLRHGMVTPEEAEAAAARAATFTFQLGQTTIRAPHFSFYVKEQLLRSFGPDAVKQGLKVITTLDLAMQERAQEIVRRRVDEIRWQQVNNGALVALNPKTGEILAMVGSYDYHNREIDGEVNVALALRQPGSSFKPFTYAAAFATRRIYPASTVVDEPLSRPDPSSPTGFYRPVNYDGSWRGEVTVRSALANSYNIPALLIQDAIGTRAVVDVARKAGVKADLPEVPSLTLGAGTVRLLDMTAAYGVFANDGVRVDTTPFLQVSTLDGQVVYEFTEPERDREIWPEVAYMINDILSDAGARRPAFGSVLDLAGGRTAAVKTGTTNDYKDSWTIGYTPSLVAGVWVGNTDNSPMMRVAGSLGAGYIWKDFMDATLAGRPNERFPVPPRIVRAPLCAESDQADLVIDGPPGTCSEPLQAGPEWKVELPAATAGRRGR